MSAFICNENQIGLLASRAAKSRDGVRHPETHEPYKAQDVALILARENLRSITARYGVDHGMLGDQSESHYLLACRMAARKWYDVAAVVVLKACHCYEYQACETGDYETTEAARIVRAVERSAMRALPGYEDAPWEFTQEASGVPLLSLIGKD